MSWPLPSTVRRKVGDLSQVADVRLVRLQDGNEDGARALIVHVAGGLQGMVMLDRGMDLGPVSYAGVPLGWVAPVGAVHPSFVGDSTWLRGFHGGLLTGAGMQNVGPDCIDEGEAHGLHGRLSLTPARNVVWRLSESHDDAWIEIEGRVREVAVYGADLELRRTMRWYVGRPRIEIRDRVENRGFKPAELMLLYHFNLGWPVVDEGSELIAPPHRAEPHDEAASAAAAERERFVAPRHGAVPEVFDLSFRDEPEVVVVGIVNPSFGPTDGVAVTIEYKPAQLPHLLHWRMMGEGLYLTGLEPSNTRGRGRSVEREAGPLTFSHRVKSASSTWQ
jgi:hypothetical protein